MYVVYSLFHPESRKTLFDDVQPDYITETEEKALNLCNNMLFEWLSEMSLRESLEEFIAEQDFDISSDYKMFEKASQEVWDDFFEYEPSSSQYETAQALFNLSDDPTQDFESLNERYHELMSIRDDIFHSFYNCEIGLYVGYHKVEVLT